jgi:hypothetical protein
MPNARFESQTKRKLVRDANLEKGIEDFMEKSIDKFMRKNKEYLDEIYTIVGGEAGEIRNSIPSYGTAGLAHLEKMRQIIDARFNNYFGGQLLGSIDAIARSLKNNTYDTPAISAIRDDLGRQIGNIQGSLHEMAGEKIFRGSASAVKKWILNGIYDDENPERFMTDVIGFDTEEESIKQIVDSEIARLKENNADMTPDQERDARVNILANGVAGQIVKEYARADASNIDKMPLKREAVLRIIDRNITMYMMAERDKFNARFEKFRENFKDKMREAIAQEKYPISSEYMEEITDSVRFRLADMMTMFTRGGMSGDYSGLDYTVRIAGTIPEEKWEATFIHEMMHALSGKHKIEIPDEDKSVDDAGLDLTIHDFARQGLSSGNGRFVWLNEALTERAALDLVVDSMKNKNTAYLEELEVLKYLQETLQIPAELFTDAYFEHYDENRVGQKQPNVQKLFDYADERFGNGFLVRLDSLIEKNTAEFGRVKGTQEALKILKTKDNKI